MSVNVTVSYAFRIIFSLDRHQNGCTAKQLAEENKIPQKYLIKVLTRMRADGLIQSVSGPNGGYRLCRGLNQIRVLDVLRIMQPSIISHGSSREENMCKESKADMEAMWNYYCDMEKQIMKQWFSMTLREIVEQYGGDAP